MSNIIDRLRVKATGQTRQDRNPVEVTLGVEETGNFERAGFGSNKEHVMMLSVATTFWAGVNYNEVRDSALRTLLTEIHEDVLMHGHKIRHAIAQQDYDRALEYAVELEEKLLKPTKA